MTHLTRLLLVAAFAFAQPAVAFERAYWAWQRNEPPNARDLAALARQGVRTLYWQLGTLRNKGDSWQWAARFQLPVVPDFEVVPVVRLESHAREPFSEKSTQALLQSLAFVQKRERLQIDYDCPDRLLSDYAATLRRIRALVPRLTITALPGWIGKKAMTEIAKNVDEVLPMFYDYAADPIVPGAAPEPLIVPEKGKSWLAAWNNYPSPWRAGVPNFARLTVYDPDGTSRGNIREWDWDSVTFNNSLMFVRQTDFGVSIFLAGANTRVGNTPLRKGQLLAARWAERDALRQLIAQAENSSARGIVIFRLPDTTAASGWSLSQLSDLSAQPHLTLKAKTDSSGQLELMNDGSGDLPPVLPGGYLLQLETEKPIFREVDEGDFAHVRGEAGAEGRASRVMFPLATRLTFSFSSLRAGERLETGLIQLAPEADYAQTRYRIVHSSQSQWQPFGK
ncbi:MAG: DUF3142 domain-containing protein [Chthoniobacterales bacterium]|nr:DUF3142 domain-containing protein [Chthoniobacterales bacterium]